MSTSKYVDTSAIVQVIGNIYKNPKLLDNENYTFIEDDFPEEFHSILFTAMFNLYKLGAKSITINAIEDYLAQRPKSLGVYKLNKGGEYLQQLADNVTESTFDYYYQRMKKMTLLRMYDNAGLDLSWIYDVDNILDTKKKQAQEDWLDNTSLDRIAEIIDKKITDVKMKYADVHEDEFVSAGEGIIELLERMKEKPEYGYPLFGKFINVICGGARLKKFYLRSAPTGVGKTRAMIADACFIACDTIYDSKDSCWKHNNTKEKVLFITTEQEVEEIQTMMLAFLSNVNEGHIIYNKYEEGEWERVLRAAEILKQSDIVIKRLPDFSLQDIENTIKYDISERKTKYVFLDYLHTSMKILSEVTGKTGIKGLREDNVLFMLSIKLKDLCNQYGVFIMSATQLNGDFKDAQVFDQNLLRGAKSIADKIDMGMIMLQTSKEDREALKPIINKYAFAEPGIKISVYKNRRGAYKDILIWCEANRATCRIEPLFITDYSYQLIPIEDKTITVKPDASAF